jgi:hypothetical protein
MDPFLVSCSWFVGSVVGRGSGPAFDPEKANDLPLGEVEKRTRLKPVR